jgi:uncharacterized membrane protein
MTKDQFLKKLNSKISILPQNEIAKCITFYSESIEDRMEEGMKEEDAVADIGSIDEIAKEIINENSIKYSLDKEKKTKSVWKILAICGFPLWLPLALAFGATGLALYISLWTVVLALYTVVLAFGLTGVLLILAGVIQFYRMGPITGGMIIGISLVLCGLSLVIMKPINQFAKSIIKCSGQLLKNIKKIFIRKKEVA